MPANHGICENIQWYVLCCDMPEFLLPVLSMPSNILVFAGSHCAALDVRRYFILGTSATAFLGNIDVAVLVRIVYVGGSGPVSRMLRRCAVICSSARVAVVSASLVTPNGTVRKKSSRQIFRKLIATSNFKASCEPVKELAEPSTTTALPVIGRLSPLHQWKQAYSQSSGSHSPALVVHSSSLFPCRHHRDGVFPASRYDGFCSAVCGLRSVCKESTGRAGCCGEASH
ncbi:uncharacterized protein [Dermacentor albipictus]|uniref:uncharacterized protein isoform X3 n=1 Tax=Dermacentor albipictus TaxID=60249 RepID=UPI0031FD9C53